MVEPVHVLNPASARAGTTGAGLHRVHVLLGAQSALLVLASVNRLWDATTVRVLPEGSLRLVEVLNLLVLAPAAALVYLLLLEHLLAQGVRPRARLGLRLGFAAALYLFAASYGVHEPANFLGARFCDGPETGGALCAIVGYQDDGLSHLLFFAGLGGFAAVLLAAQALVPAAPVTGHDRVLVLANATVVAAAIAANLGFEAIGIDLLVVAAIAAGALWLLALRGARPVIAYFAWAYTAGLVVTVAVRLA